MTSSGNASGISEDGNFFNPYACIHVRLISGSFLLRQLIQRSAKVRFEHGFKNGTIGLRYFPCVLEELILV